MDKKKLAEMEKAYFEQLLEDLSTSHLEKLVDLLQRKNPGNELSEVETPESGPKDDDDEPDDPLPS